MQFLALILFILSGFFYASGFLYADEPEQQKPTIPDQPSRTLSDKKNLEVKLIEPNYHNGVLTTTKGGTVKGEDFFLQAKNIRYVRKSENDKLAQKIFAEGDLFFTHKGRVFTGKKIEVDVDQRKSVIYDGCTLMAPWYIGGKVIELNADGSGIIHDGFMTTSENEKSDWSVESPTVHLSKGSKVKALNVRFLFAKMPLLWLPTFSTDLKKEQRAPFKYRYRYSGRLGPRLGITYDMFKYNNFKTKLFFDVLLKKGLGGGLEASYDNPETTGKFYSFNYIAHDLRGKTEHKWLRYRFKGNYDDLFFEQKGNVLDDLFMNVSYDKLSDLAMRGDYVTDTIDSGRIAPTQIKFSKGTPNTISSLTTRVRINNFQTIKQELPLFQFNVRPQTLGNSGILVNNRFSTGYLSYKYDYEARHVHNFESTRSELSQDLYKNFLFKPFSVTPRAGYTFINYNRSPHDGGNKNLAIGRFGVDINTRFMRPFLSGQQIAEPYVQYDYLTTPSVEPRHHYLYDIQDGWHRMNMMRFGVKNFFMTRGADNFLHRFNFDLYARAFFDTPTIPRKIPRIYGDASWKATPYTTYYLNSAWDTKRDKFDHVNIGSLITLTEDAALTFEYRQRDAFCWRKLDTENFVIDSFRSERRLRHSQLSDRRNTILTGLFLRVHPDLMFEFKSRHGWKRQHQPAYHAYEVDIITMLRGALKVKFSIELRSLQHKGKTKNSTRQSISCSLGEDKPRENTGFRKIGQGNYDN
jgi:hypothetical protein